MKNALFRVGKASLCAVVCALMAALPGCENKSSECTVKACPGMNNITGSVWFFYKKRYFIDYNYDGTLDKVIDYSGSKKVIISDAEELKQLNSLYLEAREKAAKGE